MLKQLLSILFIILFAQFAFGQNESKNDFKHSVGIETSFSEVSHYFIIIKNDKWLGSSKPNQILFNFNLNYKRIFTKHLSVGILGNYYKFNRSFYINYNDIENDKTINYLYNSEFKFKHYTFLVMPELRYGKEMSWFLQFGIGSGYSIIDEFNDGSLTVTGNDGDFKRIVQLPSINGEHFSFKYSIGVGVSFIFSDASLDYGYRYTEDLRHKLDLENLYLSLTKGEMYIGFSVLL